MLHLPHIYDRALCVSRARASFKELRKASFKAVALNFWRHFSKAIIAIASRSNLGDSRVEVLFCGAHLSDDNPLVASNI